MKLIGTILKGQTAYAVYSDEEIAVDVLWTEFFEADKGDVLLVPPRFRLVQVGDDPAPAVLPADLSESAFGGLP